MKRVITKISTTVTLFAVLLLVTISVSAQTYQDDVYYTPSKDKSEKTKTEKVSKKERKTYRTTNKAEDFSAAQARYAEMLSKKEREAKQMQSYSNEDTSESWITETQGLAMRDNLNRELSLYNRGGVDADNPNAIYYTEDDDYELWQPTTVTHVYVSPSSYWGFGWNLYSPYYYHPYGYYSYYDPFYWDAYPYWRGYYGYHSPFFYGGFYSHYWGAYHHPRYWGWRGHYYDPYYGRGYYGDYYSNHYRRYKYGRAPREFSSGNNSQYRRNSPYSSRREVDNNAYRRTGATTNRRYSSSYRRSSLSHRSSGDNVGITRTGRTVTPNTNIRRSVDNMGYQRQMPSRRITDSGSSYRRSSSSTDRGIRPSNTKIYRRSSSPSSYRRSSSSMMRSSSSSYRRSSTPIRSSSNSQSLYRRSSSYSNSGSSYRRSSSSSSSSGGSSYRRSSSSSGSSSSSYRRSSSRSR